MQHSSRKYLGFTLMEVVISLALGGVILTAVMSLFVGFMQAWESKETPYESFVAHVDQCTRFLRQQINTITPIVDDNEVRPEYYKIVKLISSDGLTPECALAVLQMGNLPFTHDDLSHIFLRILTLKPDGLFLTSEWSELVAKRMADGVENTGKTKSQRLLLSPYVTKIEFVHWNLDKGQWEFELSLYQYWSKFCQKTGCERPDGLRLTFKKKDWEETRFLKCNNDYMPAPKTPASNRTSDGDRAPQSGRRNQA